MSENKDANSFTFTDLWNLVWEHKMWYALSVAIFLFAGALYLYRTPEVYNRSAKVIIDESNQTATMRSLGVTSASMMTLGSSDNVVNEMEALSSPDLMKIVVERLGLQVRYFEKQIFREVELYKNSPIEIRLAGNNPLSDFSFEVCDNGDGTFTLSSFRIKKEKMRISVTGSLNDTILTPVGALVIYGVETERNFERPVIVSWENSMMAADHYLKELGVSKSGRESSVVVLSMNDTYPMRSEMIISTLIDVYNEVWISGKNKASINTTEFIDERLIGIEKKLAVVEDMLKEYKSSNSLTDIKMAAKTYIEDLSLYTGKAFEANNQLSVAEYIKSYLTDPVNYTNLIPSNLGLASASVENQIGEYNETVLLRDRLLAGSSEKNPVISELNASLLSMRSAILRSVENMISTLKLQLAKIEAQEQQILGRMSSNSDQELHLLSLERQQQITQNLYMFLLEKREENELAALVNVGNTRLIMNPNGPVKPVYPNKKMILFIMIISGFGVPFVIFFLMKYFDRTIRGRGDLSILSIPFLGEIPRCVPDGWRYKIFDRHKDNDKSVCRIMVESGNRNVINEAFRVLRTNVDLMLSKHAESKVVMMTSLNPNAGKTFTVMNLAAGMALKGSRVLLVDLDMRKASLSKALSVFHTGVAAYLNAKVDDYHEYVDEVAKGLHLLPLGTIPPNPTELLLSERFASLMEQIRLDYDYIFLDCPPIDVVADSNIITSVADLTIFVIRTNNLSKDVLPLLQQLYDEGKFNHMALVLNAVDMGSNKYGYGKSGYGYGV